MTGLRLGRPRCAAEITVTTRSLFKRTTRGEVVPCRLAVGHDEGRYPTPHEGTALELCRRAVDVTWKTSRGHAVLLSPDNLVEVNR